MKLRALAMALTAANLLSACGGGGGGDAPAAAPAPAAATTTLSGVASKGPLDQAVVKVYAVDANGVVGGTALAEFTTGPTGAYTLNLGSYTGAVQLVVTTTSATTTKDEASGASVPLPTGFTLHANTVVNAAASGVTAQTQSASITPYTELAHNIAKDSGGLTSANIAKAASVVFSLIGVDPVATLPIDATQPPAGATDAQKRYALFNAAVSKLASAAPTTADAATTACFTAAGSDAGNKIQCATQQIATAVSVTTAGAAVNKKLVGLAEALVAAAADTTINKTGTVLTADDSAASSLKAAETAVAAGETVPPIVVTTDAGRSDIALAKRFFSNLRANAAVLQSGPLDTGVTDGLQFFGDSLRSEAAAVTRATAETVQLADVALDLWRRFTSGATTSPNSPTIAGFPGGCTVYQGNFPAQPAGADGQPTVDTSVAATSPANAVWVGCSRNLGVLPTASNGVTQYRQTMLFNMSASTYPDAVPYSAVTRKRYADSTTGTLYRVNLTPTLSGTVGYVLTGADLTGFSISGDLPPATTSGGELLAARYPVDVSGSQAVQASGALKVNFTKGRLAVVPVGATAESLAVNLSSDGSSFATVPQDDSVAQQVADAKLQIAATIHTARGDLTGTLAADSFARGGDGEFSPNHIKFNGSLAVAPVIAGTVSAASPLFTGVLDVTNGSRPALSFDGGLTLPQRPALSLKVSIIQTPASGSTPASYTLMRNKTG